VFNKLFKKNIDCETISVEDLENYSTDFLLGYLRSKRACSIYAGLDRKMYALDMNRTFSDQEWNEFRIFSEKYANGKMFEMAEEILFDWELKKLTK
jgi:hypothetical protein